MIAVFTKYDQYRRDIRIKLEDQGIDTDTARLNAEMDRALADPATAKSLLQTATEPVGGGAEQLARVARADSEKYERLARELNIKAN